MLFRSVDGKEAYREAALKALRSIDKYRGYDWENSSADGYADAVESALNLFFFEPVQEAEDWINSEIKVLWDFQKPSGIIEGWHGDGNFARTSLMYCLWKTAGLTISDWRKDVIYGAVISEGKMYVTINSSDDWTGKLKFGQAMHQTNLNLPINYPRINQFQEWYSIDAEKSYKVTDAQTNKTKVVSGKELTNGYEVSVSGTGTLFLCIYEK